MGLSIVGILLGLALYLYEWIFNLWMCFCPVAQKMCVCQPPFSYYFYTIYLPFTIIGVSTVGLVWGIRLRRRLNAQS